MKVFVDSGRCQGHTLCSMIAPDSFELSDIDGTVVAGERSGAARSGGRGARSCAVVPRAGHLDRRVTPTTPAEPAIHDESAGRQALSVDDIKRRRQRAEKESVPLRPAHAGVPGAVREDHRGDAVQVPDGLDRRLQRALGRRRQQARVRTGALSGRVQRSRHQRRAQAATRASPSRRRSGPRSCAAASSRWTNPSTAPTAGR